MQNPSDTNSLRDFAEWKEKCDIKGQAYCSLPNACPLTTRELPGNVKVIHPKYYKLLKKGAHQNHLGRQKMGWFLADYPVSQVKLKY